MKNEKLSPGLLLAAHTIGCVLGGLAWTWYDYVLIQSPVRWWQWMILSVPLLIVIRSLKPASKWAVTIIGGAALIGQVCAWLGLIVLPLIKL